MDHHELEQQADHLERILSDHDAPVHITGGDVTPRWIQFLAVPAADVLPSRIESLASEIAFALGVSAVQISSSGSAMRIDVPRTDPQSLTLSSMLRRLPRQRIPPYTAVLGLADDGAPLLIRFAAPDVQHILISADPLNVQSLIRTMLVSLAVFNPARHLQIVSPDFDLPLPPNYRGTLAQIDAILATPDRRPDPRLIVVVDLDARSPRPEIDALLDRGFDLGLHLLAFTSKAISEYRYPITLTGAGPLDEFMAHTSIGNIPFIAATIRRDEIPALVGRATPEAESSALASAIYRLPRARGARA